MHFFGHQHWLAVIRMKNLFDMYNTVKWQWNNLTWKDKETLNKKKIKSNTLHSNFECPRSMRIIGNSMFYRIFTILASFQAKTFSYHVRRVYFPQANGLNWKLWGGFLHMIEYFILVQNPGQDNDTGRTDMKV